MAIETSLRKIVVVLCAYIDDMSDHQDYDKLTISKQSFRIYIMRQIPKLFLKYFPVISY